MLRTHSLSSASKIRLAREFNCVDVAIFGVQRMLLLGSKEYEKHCRVFDRDFGSAVRHSIPSLARRRRWFGGLSISEPTPYTDFCIVGDASIIKDILGASTELLVGPVFPVACGFNLFSEPCRTTSRNAPVCACSVIPVPSLRWTCDGGVFQQGIGPRTRCHSHV
jgi:hypothetical protein